MRQILALPPILLITALSTWGKLPDSHVEFPIGVTKDNTPIICWLDKGSLDSLSNKKSILLVFGMDPEDPQIQRPLKTRLKEFFESLEGCSEHYTFSVVMNANPDKKAPMKFPPEGSAYNKDRNSAAHYLWRFIGNHGFDHVISLHQPGKDVLKSGHAVFALREFGKALKEQDLANVGSVQSNLITITNAPEEFGKLLTEVTQRIQSQHVPYSEARLEIQKRLKRSPLQTAQQLAKHYGKDPRPQYIPALAQLCRLRIAELDNDPKHKSDVLNSLLPYAKGEKNPLSKKVSGVNLAGHLTIAELAKSEKDPAFTKLIIAAANQALASRGDKEGSPVAGHNQMSDSVFMVCPLLAAAYGLTGKQQYLDACLAHYKYIRSICLRDDGIYRHSPQDEAAWGRGNGFPALGLALSLSWIPEGSPAHKELLTALQAHIDALLPHQDITGMWHQVIDHPEVYREMTSTCMFTFSIARCLNRGWLPKEKYLPVVKKSWPAINRRISTNGELLDVCTGTGKQKNLRAYFDRTAILGKDSRGGAMALMASTEIEELQRNLKEK